jgi:hypothetical protein
MYLSIIDAKPLENYRLLLTFDNDEKRIFNVSPYLGKGIFTELRNQKTFQSVKVNFDTIAWENGADIDPEVLYEDSIPLEE